MNIRESNATNALLHWVLAGSNPAAEDAARAKEAAEFLSGRAYKALIAGLRPADVTAAWPTSTRTAGSLEDERPYVPHPDDEDGTPW